jgi:phage tail sheath gpL-like
MAISNAVPSDWVSKIVGYLLNTANFNVVSPNLPQRVAVFAEANDANQATLNLTPQQFSNAQLVGQAYGYGSPAHIIARILFPKSGGGIQVPVWFYPQAKASGATTKTFQIATTGVANNNGTHYLKIAGREGLDGQTYALNIQAGDSLTQIAGYIYAAINNVLGAPVTSVTTPYGTTCTSKWSGATANDLSISIDTNGDALGLTYVVTPGATAIGTPDVTLQLANFGNIWNTIVLNSYGLDATVLTALENFNGVPSNTTPTGRFNALIVKPFIAIAGSVLADPSSLTDTRLTQVTNAVAPAPLSAGLPMEAAANMSLLFANILQNTPELDVEGYAYPDMPTPTSISTMSDSTNRNTIVKKGCSTVDLINGQYVVQDFVTTYHPIGENPPQFRYPRDLMGVDMNVYYTYYLLVQQYLSGAVLANDADIVSSSKVVKPKTWKANVSGIANQLVSRGLIVNAQFMKDSILVAINSTNSNRLDTSFSYQRSGVARIVSTTATAGFNNGNV